MKEWEIWSEGYVATGESSRAFFEGKFIGETFDDAVEKFKETYSGQVDTRQGYGPRNEDGIMPLIKIHSIWGCRLFPTEAEARKSFG